MPVYTNTTMNNRLRQLGVMAYWPLRGNTTEALGDYATTTATVGSAVTWNGVGPDSSARASNSTCANLPGTANSWINLKNVAGCGARMGTTGFFGIGFSMKMKTTNSTQVWQFGYVNGSTDRFQFGHQWGATNLELDHTISSTAAGFLCNTRGTTTSSTGGANALNDGDWHHYFFAYDFARGRLAFFVDGERWDISRAGTQTTVRGLTPIDFPDFMLGAIMFSGTPSVMYSMEFCDVVATNTPLSELAIYEIAKLSSVNYKPGRLKDYELGYNATRVGEIERNYLLNGNSARICIGDSTLSSSGEFRISEKYRQINLLSGGKLANYPILPNASVGDTYTLPFCYATIATTATSRYYTKIRNWPADQFNNLTGSDNELRDCGLLDLSDGIIVDVYLRKQTSPTGSVTITVKGSYADIQQVGGNDAGTEGHHKTIGTLTIPAGDLVGVTGSTGKFRIDCPLGSPYGSFLVEIVNNLGQTQVLHLIDIISRKNQYGPRAYVIGGGGYQTITYAATHGTCDSLITALGTSQIEVDLGINDSGFYAVSGFVTNFSGWIAARIAVNPNLAFIWNVPGSRGLTYDAGNGKSQRVYDDRVEAFVEAMEDWAASNTSVLLKIANVRRFLMEAYGWTPGTQSFVGWNVTPAAYNNATTYNAGNWVTIALAWDGTTAYYYSRVNSQTGIHPTSTVTWQRMLDFIYDGVHRNRVAQILEATTEGAFMLRNTNVGSPNVMSLQTSVPLGFWNYDTTDSPADSEAFGSKFMTAVGTIAHFAQTISDDRMQALDALSGSSVSRVFTAPQGTTPKLPFQLLMAGRGVSCYAENVLTGDVVDPLTVTEATAENGYYLVQIPSTMTTQADLLWRVIIHAAESGMDDYPGEDFNLRLVVTDVDQVAKKTAEKVNRPRTY